MTKSIENLIGLLPSLANISNDLRAGLGDSIESGNKLSETCRQLQTIARELEVDQSLSKRSTAQVITQNHVVKELAFMVAKASVSVKAIHEVGKDIDFEVCILAAEQLESQLLNALRAFGRLEELANEESTMPAGQLVNAVPYDPTRLEEWRTIIPQPGEIAFLMPNQPVEYGRGKASQPEQDEQQRGRPTRIDASQAFKVKSMEPVGASEFIRTAQARAQASDAMLEQQRSDDALAYEKARASRAEAQAKRNAMANEPEVGALVRAAITARQLIETLEATSDIDTTASLALRLVSRDLLAALHPFIPNVLVATSQTTPPAGA